MKKRLVIIFIIAGIFIGFFIFSLARGARSLPKPEDMAGKEASKFMPEESQGKPTAKGSAQLKLTGPVWVEQ